jgi:PEP-CTERM motif
MTYRKKLVLAFGATLGLASLVPHQAQAGLLGAGRTVQAFYYNGVFAGPEGEDSTATGNSLPAPLNVPVDYVQGALDGSTIAVGDTQIVITNQLSNAPFCFDGTSSGTMCADVISGFDFKFTGENILDVSVDAASVAAGDFLPVTGTFQGNTHLGLQLLSNNEIQVDVTGDLPALNSELVLDLSFTSGGPAVPEPASLVLLGSALLGLAGVRRIRKSRLDRSSDPWAVPEHRPGHGA